MSVRIIPFREEHVQDAAALFAAAYRTQRKSTPSLPPRHQESGTIVPLLRQLAARVPGVAAIRDGQLVGYILGMLLESFRGQRSVYVPEWANALGSVEESRVFQEMYAQVAIRWAANGGFRHLFTALVQSTATLDALHWLGFGLMGVDAIRDLTPVEAQRNDLTVQRADREDAALALALDEALDRYIAQSPTFLAYADKHTQAYHDEWLSNPNHALWLAFKEDKALACIGFEPSNPDAAYIISDAATMSITRAITVEYARRSGIGTELLRRGLKWAKEAGYARCAVDFEPQNMLGARFWMRHFQPVCYSLERHIDPRIAWANESREEGDIW